MGRSSGRAGVQPGLLHEWVGDEWSFIETLRHFPFATDSGSAGPSWATRGPGTPSTLPWDEMRDTPGVPRDRHARPSLDEALALRRDRYGDVRAFLANLTAEHWRGTSSRSRGRGGRASGSFPVKECLRPSSTRSGGTACSRSGTYAVLSAPERSRGHDTATGLRRRVDALGRPRWRLGHRGRPAGRSERPPPAACSASASGSRSRGSCGLGTLTTSSPAPASA